MKLYLSSMIIVLTLIKTPVFGNLKLSFDINHYDQCPQPKMKMLNGVDYISFPDLFSESV